MPEKRTEVCKIDPDASLENKMLAVAGHTPKQIQELTSINIGGVWVWVRACVRACVRVLGGCVYTVVHAYNVNCIQSCNQKEREKYKSGETRHY